MKNPKYIIQVDKKYWRVKIRLDKETANKCFNFDKYGGKGEAQIAAILWRNKVLKKHDLLDRLNYEKSPNFFHNYGTNPIIGVALNYNYQCNKYVYNWTVRYSNNGKEYKKHFSVNKYGTEKAFKKACEVRFKYCGKLRVLKKEDMPCKLPRRLLNG